jgi:hypothetical protein
MTRIPGSLQEIRALMPTSIYEAYRELRRAMENDGTLDERLKELIRLKSAELAGCVH